MSHPKHAIWMLTALMITFLVSTPFSRADITLDSPDQGVLATQDVTFTFTTADTPQDCTLIINGANNQTIVSSQHTFSVPLELNDGDYTWSASCNINATRLSSQTKQLTIDTTPPKVRLVTPQTTFNASIVSLSYYSEDAHLKSCALMLNTGGSMHEVMTSQAPATGRNNTFQVELQDGQYEWNTRCTDSAGYTTTPIATRTFSIDTTPPVVTVNLPPIVVTATSTELRLITSEDAQCSYGTTQNTTPTSLFATTGARQHIQPLTSLGDGTYTYYIACADLLHNGMPAKQIQFSVHLPPTATISLSDPSPVKAGIIEITLKTSKKLIQEPKLTYNFPGKDVQIALSGQDDEWHGNILIDEQPQEAIATFSFQGTDGQGYTGTTITEGKSFVIDTIKPPRLSNIKAEAKDSGITISWYSDSSDIGSYRIYKSTNSETSYLDLYATINGSPFTDRQLQDKVTYYYKVAPLDEAGNLGELSDSVYATANGGSSQPAQAPQQEKPSLPPNLVLEVNDAAKHIENAKLSIEEAASNMNGLAGRELEIAEALGIKGQADNAKQQLDNLISQLDSLKQDYKEESALRSQVAGILNKSSQIESETVKSIKIDGHVEDLPAVKKEQTLKALDATFAPSELSQDDREGYSLTNDGYIQDMQIKTSADIVKITKTNGDVQDKTFITHSFTYAGPQAITDSVVIVFMPKAVASSSTELTYPGNRPEVLKDDPVLKWGFLKMGPESQIISYILNKKLSDYDVRSIEIVPLANINKAITEKSTPTGFAVLRNIPGKSTNYWLIIAGVLVVAILGGYYFSISQKVRGDQPSPDAIPQHIMDELDQRLSTIQVEIDEEIFPILTSIRKSVVNRDEVSAEKMLTKLMETANTCISSNQTPKAKSLYPAIQLLYQSLAQDQKTRFSAECIRLYQQINRK